MVMAKKRPKKPNPWPAKLKKLRDGLGLTNEEIADKLRIPERLWLSWLYGERQPSPAGKALLSLLEEDQIK